MESLMLDGNAVAGLLNEVLSAEMTTAVQTCAGCGTSEPIGAVHVYRGAGVVLRCPHCENVLMTIVKSDTSAWISAAGVRRLQILTG